MDEIPAADRLLERLKNSLRVALKARDSTAVAALRSALSAIDNAGAADRSHHAGPGGEMIATARLGVGVGDVARWELSKQDLIEILRAEVLDRTTAAADYEHLGRSEDARRLRAEAATLVSHLAEALKEL